MVAVSNSIQGYAVGVLSSVAEIQSHELFAKDSPPLHDILSDSVFFLRSASKDLTPRVVAVSRDGELVGVVYAKEQDIFSGLRLVHIDLTFGTPLLGDPTEQKNTFLVVLETLLTFRGTRGLRLSVRPRSSELAAVRSLIASSVLDFRFWRQDGHAVLSLPCTYEDLLEGFGSRTRHNFRYYRRRFEAAGHVYVARLSMDELRRAVIDLGPKCRTNRSFDSIKNLLEMVSTAHQPLAVGLRHRSGEWLSVIGGAYRRGTGVLYLQLNNDRDFSRDSLSVVLRGYLIESLIQRGLKEFVIWGGTSEPLHRYTTQHNTIGISIDSSAYHWRLLRSLKSAMRYFTAERSARIARTR